MDVLAAVPDFYAEQAAKCADVGSTSKGSGSATSRCAPAPGGTTSTCDALEEVSTANLENVWNGRPISKLMLREPVPVRSGHTVPLVELIPPFHQRVYRMGLEHVGFVVGDDVDEFGRTYREVLTGQQFQSPVCEPYYVMFPDYTHVKFYRWSLGDVVEREGNTFDRTQHADWNPADELAGPYELA